MSENIRIEISTRPIKALLGAFGTGLTTVGKLIVIWLSVLVAVGLAIGFWALAEFAYTIHWGIGFPLKIWAWIFTIGVLFTMLRAIFMSGCALVSGVGAIFRR